MMESVLITVGAVLLGLVVGLAILYYRFYYPSKDITYAAAKRKVPAFHEIYEKVGCPACGYPHKYGLDRDYLDCYACSKTFSPAFEGRKYESYKRGN